MNLSTLILTFPQLANADCGLLVDVIPYRSYDANGQPTQAIAGYKYVTVLPQNGYEKLNIKVEQATPIFSKEDIEKNGGAIKVKPIGFIGKFYRTNNGGVDVSCKATSIEVVK